VGIASKSGVSGVIYGVIPNVMSIAVYSPRLDKIGNSVRGVEFFKRFTQRYNFHIFDSLTVNNKKKSITKQYVYHEDFNTFLLLEAASKNDLELLRRLLAQNVSVNAVDYDRRSALHVATSNRNKEAVAFLLAHGADLAMQDRWGHCALDDAVREGADDLVQMLRAESTSESTVESNVDVDRTV
jgi:glutaminase